MQREPSGTFKLSAHHKSGNKELMVPVLLFLVRFHTKTNFKELITHKFLYLMVLCVKVLIPVFAQPTMPSKKVGLERKTKDGKTK